jgi:hypothetical protein
MSLIFSTSSDTKASLKRSAINHLVAYASILNDFAIDYVAASEEKPPEKRKRGPNRPRPFDLATQIIYNDYFADDPIYPEALFRRRFRMSRPLFSEIHDKLVATNPYFVRKRGRCSLIIRHAFQSLHTRVHWSDATGKLGASSLQKICSALKILTTGCSFDSVSNLLFSHDAYRLPGGRLMCFVPTGRRILQAG